MHPDARFFVRQYLAVVLAALAPVVFTAFLAMPASLGGHPGEQRIGQAETTTRHMT